MEIKAFMKKSYLYTMLVVGVIILTVGIILTNVTLILAASLILLAIIWMLIVYTNKPALEVTKEAIIFQGLFSKTEYIISDIGDLQYKNNRISFTYVDTRAEIFIQNSYNVSITKIMEAIKTNKNQGENNDTSFTENN